MDALALTLAGLAIALLVFGGGVYLGHYLGRKQGFCIGWRAYKDQARKASLDAVLYGTAFVTEDPNKYMTIHGEP